MITILASIAIFVVSVLVNAWVMSKIIQSDCWAPWLVVEFSVIVVTALIAKSIMGVLA